VTTRPGAERPIVATVTESSPAFQDGIYPEDELVAIDGARIDNANFSSVLKERKPGAKAALGALPPGTPDRNGADLGRRENVTLAIVPRKDASARERAVYEDWLKARWKKES